MSDSTVPKCKDCGNYDEHFILGLKKQLLGKIAFETNKDLANLKYNLGLCNHVDATIVLTQYVDILDRLLDLFMPQYSKN